MVEAEETERRQKVRALWRQALRLAEIAQGEVRIGRTPNLHDLEETVYRLNAVTGADVETVKEVLAFAFGDPTSVDKAKTRFQNP